MLSYGTTLISGGTFESTRGAAMRVRSGTTTVTGGSFTGKADENGVFTGVPNGEYTVEYMDAAILVLKGGEFPNGFAAERSISAAGFLAEGYFFCDEDGAKRIVKNSQNRITGAVQVLRGDDALEPPTYSITVSESEHGTVTADKTEARENDTVTLTATPDKGYTVKSWNVTAEDGSTVETTEDNTFTMPNSDVTVAAEFERGYEYNLQIKAVDPDGKEIPIDQIGYIYGNLGDLSVTNRAPLIRKLVPGEYRLDMYYVSNPEYLLPEDVTLTLHEDGTLTSDGAHVTVEDDGEVTWIVVTIEESGYRFAVIDENGKEVRYLMPERDYTATFGREGEYSITLYAYDRNTDMYLPQAISTETTFRMSREDYNSVADKFAEYGYEFNTLLVYISENDNTSELRYIPIFDSERVFVTFQDHDGTALKEEFVKPGESAEAPEEPTREGYTFSGWDKDFENVSEDITVTARYTKIRSGGGSSGGNVSGGSKSEEKPEDKAEEKPEDTPASDTEEKKTFADTANHWAKDDIAYVSENGLMQGTGGDAFTPDGKVTRAMLVTVLYRAEGSPAVNRSIPFADVDLGAWYGDAVIWAQQNGIVNGVSETEFAPDAAITREQAAAIIYRYAEYKGSDVSQKAELSEYADADQVSAYAEDAMRYAIGTGIIGGKPGEKLDPKGNTTRAELAAILHRFLEN